MDDEARGRAGGDLGTRLLPFLPSLALGAVGAIWVLVSPPEFDRQPSLFSTLVTAALLSLLLLAGGWLLERASPSYRAGSRTLEAALRRLRIGRPLALLLALLTAAGEELLFRGGLMQPLGVWGQALLFGLLHPISRRAWAYTAYTAVAGLLFGYAALLSGSLWAPFLAHFAINLRGLLSVARPRAPSR